MLIPPLLSVRLLFQAGSSAQRRQGVTCMHPPPQPQNEQELLSLDSGKYTFFNLWLYMEKSPKHSAHECRRRACIEPFWIFAAPSLGLHADVHAKSIWRVRFVIFLVLSVFLKNSAHLLMLDAGLPTMSWIFSKGQMMSSSCRTPPDWTSVSHRSLAVPSLGLLQAPHDATGNSSHKPNTEVRGLINYANPREMIRRRF